MVERIYQKQIDLQSILFLETIRIRIREFSHQHIKIILNDLMVIEDEYSKIIMGINTHHTLNILYNTTKYAIDQMRYRGVLDVDDCDLLEQSLKHMYIHLRIPSTKPPAPPLVTSRHLAFL